MTSPRDTTKEKLHKPPQKSRTPTHHKITYSHHYKITYSNSRAQLSPFFFNIAPKLSRSILNLSTPLWPTSYLRKAWLNRSGELPTSPEPVWTAPQTALGQTSVKHDEPWPETAKNITQSLVLLSHTPNVMRPRFHEDGFLGCLLWIAWQWPWPLTFQPQDKRRVQTTTDLAGSFPCLNPWGEILSNRP